MSLSKWLFKNENTIANKMNNLAKENLQNGPILEDILSKVEEQAKKGKFSLNYPIRGIERQDLIKALKKEGFSVGEELVWDYHLDSVKLPESNLCLVISWRR